MKTLTTAVLSVSVSLAALGSAHANLYTKKSLAEAHTNYQKTLAGQKYDGFNQMKNAKPGSDLYKAMHGGTQGAPRIAPVLHPEHGAE